jgi:hypothetical protein
VAVSESQGVPARRLRQRSWRARLRYSAAALPPPPPPGRARLLHHAAHAASEQTATLVARGTHGERPARGGSLRHAGSELRRQSLNAQRAKSHITQGWNKE